MDQTAMGEIICTPEIWKYFNMVKVTNEAIGENTVSDL